MSIGAHPFDYGLIEKRDELYSRHRTLTGLVEVSYLLYNKIFSILEQGTHRVSHSGGSVLIQPTDRVTDPS